MPINMHRPLPSIAALAFAAGIILAASSAAPIGLNDGKGCDSSKTNPYVGTYRWRGAPTAEPVRFWFERTETAGDGVVKAFGRGIYISKPPVNITIRATIDVKTRRIEIWESNPDRLTFLTKGSHVGTISSDRCRILAVWTTEGTGQRGDLFLEMTPK